MIDKVMFRGTLVALSSVALAAALTWSDCSEHRDTDAVSFNNIDAKPNHILLPGDLHVTLNLTFNRQIEHAYLDFELYRHILGFPLKIPCIHGTIIGSCNNIDACRIFNSILRDPNHQGDYGHQAESIMLAALGHYIQCPLKPETVLVGDGVVKLDPVPSTLSVLTDGDYTIRVRGKESINGTYSLGCIIVNATVGRDSANIFG